MRGLAVEYATNLLGESVAAPVADALQLPTLCGHEARPAPSTTPPPPPPPPPPPITPAHLRADLVLHVAPDADPSGEGTARSPLPLREALERVRVRDREAHRSATVLLRGGEYRLASPLTLTAEHGGASAAEPLTIAAAPGDGPPAVVSGAPRLDGLRWERLPGGVFRAALPPHVDASAVRSLYVEGERPNADPRVTLYPEGYSFNCTWGADLAAVDGAPFSGGRLVDLCAANATGTPPCNRAGTHFPDSPWFDGGWACRFFPCEASADYGDHSPCVHGAVSVPRAGESSWAHPEDAEVHALHDGSWGGWGFHIASKEGARLAFRDGGHQEQTGTACNGSGRACNGFYLSNVLEELDAPGEFAVAGGALYVMPNRTGTAWQRDVCAAVTERLLELVGTQGAPVRHVSVAGVTFTRSRVTFLGGATAPRFAAPGTGDWSIYPSAALHLEGAEGVAVTNCTFREIGGNALLMLGYNRFNRVALNEFVGLGDSAVALVGRPRGGLISVDGTNGDFPSDNVVDRNHIHETGVLTKQSAPYFQTVACHNNVTNNVMYNGPRAGICLNDGFGGGDRIAGNLIFNQVRETNDHGNINAWDRGPYVTLRGEPPGVPSVTPAWKVIERNFLIASGNWPLDFDDGSRFIVDRNNVVFYGGTKNYHGYNKTHKGNLFIRPDLGCGSRFCGENDASGVTAPLALNERWENNTCVTAATPYYGACDAPDPASPTSMQYRFNTFMTPSGSAADFKVDCGVGTARPRSFAAWQAAGWDEGSAVRKMPDTAGIIALARERLRPVLQ